MNREGYGFLCEWIELSSHLQLVYQRTRIFTIELVDALRSELALSDRVEFRKTLSGFLCQTHNVLDLTVRGCIIG